MLKRDWITWSKCVDHSRRNSHPNGDLYGHLVTRIILTFDKEQIILMSSENYEESSYGHDLDLLIIH